VFADTWFGFEIKRDVALDREIHQVPAAQEDAVAVEVLLSFGDMMLCAGSSAARTREWLEVIARKLGFDFVHASISLDSILVTVERRGERHTAMREIGSPGINVGHIAELEQLATTKQAATPREIAATLAEIAAMPTRYTGAQVVLAIAAASSSFAFINGAGAPEMIAAAVGGGAGQCLRAWPSRRRLNPHGVAALSSFVASGTYVVAAALAGHIGFEFKHYPAGFIASCCFWFRGSR
jgi:uncharacterized membrane protein YjjP (DUF1212 family)